MHPSHSHKKMIEKFTSLEDKDDLDISWSSSGSESSAFSPCVRSSSRRPVTICRKRKTRPKPKRRSRHPSAKLRINKQEHPNKCVSNASKNFETLPRNNSPTSQQPESPILRCDTTAVSSKYENFKSNVSNENGINEPPTLRKISNDHYKTNDLTLFNKKKIGIPIYKSFSRNSNESYFSPNKESSPILSQMQFNNDYCTRTISQLPISPLLSIRENTNVPTHLNNINISPLLNNTILVDEQYTHVKRKLTFEEPTADDSFSLLHDDKMKFDSDNENEMRVSPILEKHYFTNKQKSELSQSSPILSAVRYITSTNKTEENGVTEQKSSVFRRFSFKSEPCSQVSIDDNSTPVISRRIEPIQSQISIISFTPTSEIPKSSHSKEIVMYSSPSTVEVKTEPDGTITDVGTAKYTVSGPPPAAKLRKKRLKRDGLACRLQNALRARKSTASIWKHEMFLAANTNFDIPIGDPPLCLTILEGKKEYGILTLSCEEMFTNDKYVVIINEFLVKSAVFTDGQSISVYKPYELHIMLMFGNSVNVILNACKINY